MVYNALQAQNSKKSKSSNLNSRKCKISVREINPKETTRASAFELWMNSGIFNNPFMMWGKYRIDGDKALLPISFRFHHTQMDGVHAGAFLKKPEDEIAKFVL